MQNHIDNINFPAVLLTGGAGYIGTHIALALIDSGYRVVVVDDLSTGCEERIPPGAMFLQGDIADDKLIETVVRDHKISGVIHTAGSTVVSDSIKDPIQYYENNTLKSLKLISNCVEYGANRFVFSSSAAVYGDANDSIVQETSPKAPMNPYGHSKLMTEQILQDAASAYDLRIGILRYFNVAGADPSGRAGQSSRNATHLIKRVAEVATEKRKYIEIFGTDYETPDGTCIRDFIHVSDLAQAHILAFEHILKNSDNLILNCGYGRGYSVREVIATAEAEVGRKLDVREGSRRKGDPRALIADTSEIQRVLEWKPTHNDLATMVKSATAWERSLKPP